MPGLLSSAPKRIVLHGYLKKLHSEASISLPVKSAAEAIEIISEQAKEIFKPISGFAPPIQVVINDKWVDQPAELYDTTDADEIHLVPMVSGGKSILKTILIGAAIIAVSFFVPSAWAVTVAGTEIGVGAMLFMAGLGIVLMGVSQLLMPAPTVDNSNVDESGQFGAPKNTVKIGTRIPLAYGKQVPIGGHVLSYNVDSRDRSSGSYPGSSSLAGSLAPIVFGRVF